jgi:integrase
VALLRSRQRFAPKSVFVFPRIGDVTRPMPVPTHWFAKVRETVPFMPHDLRRTFAGIGRDQPLLKLLMGHIVSDITQVYAGNDIGADMHAAADVITARILKLAGASTPAKLRVVA